MMTLSTHVMLMVIVGIQINLTWRGWMGGHEFHTQDRGESGGFSQSTDYLRSRRVIWYSRSINR